VVRVADDVRRRRSDCCSRLPHTSTTSTASVAKYHIRYHYYHYIPRSQRARVPCPTLNSTLVVCSLYSVDHHNSQLTIRVLFRRRPLYFSFCSVLLRFYFFSSFFLLYILLLLLFDISIQYDFAHRTRTTYLYGCIIP